MAGIGINSDTTRAARRYAIGGGMAALLAICFVASTQRDGNEPASIRHPVIIGFLAEIDGWPDSSTRYSYLSKNGAVVWVTLFPGPAAKLQSSIREPSTSLGDAVKLLYDLPYDP